MLQEFLGDAGYRTQSAADGWECLKIAGAAEKPDLILLDYQMPGITGIDVLSILKKDGATREILVIMISGNQDIEEMSKSHGVHAVLQKPLDLRALMETISNALY